MYMLEYNYFGVDYDSLLMPLNVNFVFKDFSTGLNNLSDSTATSRVYTEIINYEPG